MAYQIYLALHSLDSKGLVVDTKPSISLDNENAVFYLSRLDTKRTKYSIFVYSESYTWLCSSCRIALGSTHYMYYEAIVINGINLRRLYQAIYACLAFMLNFLFMISHGTDRMCKLCTCSSNERNKTSSIAIDCLKMNIKSSR